MALAQILGNRDQVVDDAGNPLSGGLVNIYEPNTTTRVSSYSDSALSAENVNPVVLNGGGRANIWVNRNVDVRITDKDGNLISEELSVNPDSLTGTSSSGLVPNGSFETDANADNIPDGWTLESSLTGSTNQISTAQASDGGQSFAFTSTGSGGGELRTTDFFPVNETDDLRVDFDILATVATMRNIVRIEWYDVSQVSISNTDVYDSTANPLVWTSQTLQGTPPVGARFAKIRILGGTTGGLVAGTSYFDNFNVFYPQVVAGVFDNITISGNSIISTNTNGNINLTPNGSGDTVISALTATGAELTDPDILVGGNIKLEPVADGINVMGSVDTANPPSTELALTRVRFRNLSNSADLGDIGFITENRLSVRNLMHGGAIRLAGEDTGGTTRTTFEGDPDGAANIYNAGNLRISAQGSGAAQVRSVANTDAEQRILSLTHQDGTERGRVGHESGVALVLRNMIHGANTAVQGEDLGGVTRTIMQGDPDGAAGLYYAGTDRVGASLTGLAYIKSDDNVATSQRILGLFTQDGSTRYGLFGTTGGSTTLRVRGEHHGAPVLLEAEDNAGAVTLLVNADPDGAVVLYHAGNFTVETLVDGVNIRATTSPGIGSAQDIEYRLSQADNSIVGRLGFLSSTTMYLRNLNHGSSIALQAEDTAGINRTLYVGDPDGRSEIYSAGTLRLTADADGVAVRSDTNTDAETRLLYFEHQDGTVRAFAGHNGGGVLDFENRVHGEGVRLRAENASGSARNLVTADPDTGVEIYYAGNNETAIETVDRTASDRSSSAAVRDTGGTLHDIGFNLWPKQAISGGNHTLAKADQGKNLFYNEATARSLFLNNDATIPADAAFVLTVGPAAGTMTLDGGTGVTMVYWNGSGWTTTSAAANLTAGAGQYTIRKESDTQYYVVGPNLS